mgnify:CR=1 FL=1
MSLTIDNIKYYKLEESDEEDEFQDQNVIFTDRHYTLCCVMKNQWVPYFY